jgi:hypothetical protein
MLVNVDRSLDVTAAGVPSAITRVPDQFDNEDVALEIIWKLCGPGRGVKGSV